MLLNRLQDKNKKLFLQLETILVHIDGEYSDTEKKIVKNHCEEMGLEPIEYDSDVDIKELAGMINNEMSVEEKKIIFIELITVAIIDGVYDSREKEFVESLGKMLALPKEVGDQAFEMVQKLIDATESIENFVEW